MVDKNRENFGIKAMEDVMQGIADTQKMWLQSFGEPMKTWFTPTGWTFPLGTSASDCLQAWVGSTQRFIELMGRMAERATRNMRDTLKPETVTEFYDSWRKNCEEMFSGAVQAQPADLSRQMTERSVKAIDAYAKFISLLTDVNLKAWRTGVEAFGEIASKTQEMSKLSPTPDSLGNACNLMLGMMEQRYADMFESPELAAAAERTLRASMDLCSPIRSSQTPHRAKNVQAVA